jgi:hypothetical protein
VERQEDPAEIFPEDGGGEGQRCRSSIRAVGSNCEAKAEEESDGGQAGSKKDEGSFLSKRRQLFAEVQKKNDDGKRKDEDAGLV